MKIDVDALAQEIRRVDGNHSLGAGALAEALMPFITAALAEQTQQGVEVKDWHRSDNAYGGVMLYSLREDGWRKGAPIMTNDVTIRIERSPGSETDIALIVRRLFSALVDVPVVESEPVAWRWKFDPDAGWHYGGEEPKGFRFGDPEIVEVLYAHPPRSLSTRKGSAGDGSATGTKGGAE